MTKTKKDKRTAHQKEVDRIYEQLASIEDTGSREYQACLDSLKALTDVECTKLQAKPRKEYYELLKPFIVGAVGMAEILVILCYEERNIIPKKALDFVLRGRV